MPFKLAQRPAYFTTLMQKVFCTFNNFSFFHMGNALVHDSNEEHHLEHLKMIFLRIRKGLKLKLSKYAFFKRHLQYLGHLISGVGNISFEGKSGFTSKSSAPKDVTETRHIKGLASY